MTTICRWRVYWCSILCTACTGETACIVRVVFFFQAEDGIRDLVRSRGLGDVYKRQGQGFDHRSADPDGGRGAEPEGGDAALHRQVRAISVSYTHLTLPTSDLV